ncbi:MAG: hypothetical protein WC755_00470 [Candidatus Woesearchaeota archaeon]|jgi:hypothetical protein
MAKGEHHTHHVEHNSHHTDEHHNSEGSGSNIKFIIAGIIGALLVIALVLFLVNRVSDSDVPKVDDSSSVIADIKEIVEDKKEEVIEKVQQLSCEEQVRQLTPSTVKLTKNSIDTVWAYNNKNNTLNKWTDGKTMSSIRFIRYYLSAGNVYKGDKPLSGEAHYFIYENKDIYFEINPLLKEDVDTLDIKEGYGGQLFYTQEFKVNDLGIVSCVLRNLK